MLIKGKIPDKEPIISVGLVLPIDKQGTIIINNDKEQKKYLFEAKNNHLLINGEKSGNIQLHGSPIDTSFTLDPIPAGRGFHWEKKITIQVIGSLEISNINGSLFIVNQIRLESYLMCVATSEMSGECPLALLEAQTIAARSWLLAAAEQKHLDLGLDACNDDCCQRYQGTGNLSKKARLAANTTKGKFLIFDDMICDTRYSKCCGGVSENNENVWPSEPKPYLRGIFDGKGKNIPTLERDDHFLKWLKRDHDCYCGNNYVRREDLKKYLGKVDENGNYFRWEFTYTQHELIKIVNNKTGKSFQSIVSLKPLKRGYSGRITQLEISGEVNGKAHTILLENEYEIRRVLHPEFLYSSAFSINANSGINSSSDKITLIGAGWGHGVGLCQIGSLGMALSGKSSKDILEHYFLSATIKKLYD